MSRRRPRKRGRRIFLISALAVGGGLALGIGWLNNKLAHDRRYRLEGAPGEVALGAWLTIDREGIVRVAMPHQEMGQGIHSTTAMLVAEELDADPASLRPVQAPDQAVFANPVAITGYLPFDPESRGVIASSARWSLGKLVAALGVQLTGGSTSVRNVYQSAREAGAAARGMLLRAAAAQLAVPVAELSTAQGMVEHRASGRRLSYGELADSAALVEPSEAPQLKPSGQWRLIGRGMPRLDVPAKSDGSASFGIDVRLPGQLYAAIVHCPVFGGRLAEASLPEGLPGVRRLVTGADYVAVVADRYWRARRALDQAQIRWDDGEHAGLATDTIFASYARALDAGSGREWEAHGDVAAFLGSGDRRVAAEYRAPFLAHATMEPPNCTVRVDEDRCEVHVGTQVPTFVRWVAALTADVPFDAVSLHVPYLGGGFGRRLEVDYVREAVEIARRFPGEPVQTLWSREEDVARDVYRPAALARLEAVLDDAGLPRAWSVSLAGPSLTAQFAGRLHPLLETTFLLPDKTNVEGAVDLPYGLPNRRVSHAEVEVPVPVGNWRSVGYSQNAWFVESFVDECAQAAGIDPYEYRRRLLERAPRHRKVLDAAARRAGWGMPLAASGGLRRGRGIALVESFGSIVCEVVEVEVDQAGAIRVPRVVAAVDCGLAVDPVNVAAQVRGAIHFGLSAARFGRIDIRGGRAVQSNFNDYRVVTLAEAPRVEVELIDSDGPLGGVGEIGTPPIAPALANAFFAATGQRLRSLPLDPS